MANAPHTVYIQAYTGSPKDTTFTTEDGTQLHPSEATVWMDPLKPHEITLTFIMPTLDVKAIVTHVEFKCPVCDGKLEHDCNDGILM